MFDAPLALAMPDLRLPAFNDSHTVSIPDNAGLYETALARYHDDRYRLVLDRGGRNSDAALLHGVTETGGQRPWTTVSTNFPNSGFAILASGSGRETTWFCIDYGPHGGGHGHPDKLGFVLFGQGQILAPDPGTANYGVPIQAGWYRTTLAHNTLTIDEVSQKPAEGQCDAFLARPGFSAAMAEAGKICDGVDFRRTVALVDDNLLVFIDQIRADKEHTFDLAYHNVGKLLLPPFGAVPSEIPKKPGYSYLRDLKRQTSENGLQLAFGSSGGKQVGWSMAGGESTTFFTGTGVGAHTEDRVPLIISRRQAKETVYLWCVILGAPPEKVELTAESVSPDGQTSPRSAASAVRVKTATATHLIVANPLEEKIVVANQPLSARIAHLKADAGGKNRIQQGIPASYTFKSWTANRDFLRLAVALWITPVLAALSKAELISR
jgi:hypothetical protein